MGRGAHERRCRGESGGKHAGAAGSKELSAIQNLFRFRRVKLLDGHWQASRRSREMRTTDFSGIIRRENRGRATIVQRTYLWGRRVSSGGTETATVMARSGGFLEFCSASTSISIACPALGGIWMVAVRSPLSTQACPVFGRPSHPKYGMPSQRSRSISEGNS